MIAPDIPAPSYIHRQKPNNAVVPSVLLIARIPEILDLFSFFCTERAAPSDKNHKIFRAKERRSR